MLIKPTMHSPGHISERHPSHFNLQISCEEAAKENGAATFKESLAQSYETSSLLMDAQIYDLKYIVAQPLNGAAFGEACCHLADALALGSGSGLRSEMTKIRLFFPLPTLLPSLS
jgi:hypothetical protein